MRTTAVEGTCPKDRERVAALVMAGVDAIVVKAFLLQTCESYQRRIRDGRVLNPPAPARLV